MASNSSVYLFSLGITITITTVTTMAPPNRGWPSRSTDMIKKLSTAIQWLKWSLSKRLVSTTTTPASSSTYRKHPYEINIISNVHTNLSAPNVWSNKRKKPRTQIAHTKKKNLFLIHFTSPFDATLKYSLNYTYTSYKCFTNFNIYIINL